VTERHLWRMMDGVVATPDAPSRPLWQPVPFLVRARAGLAWAALSGVLAVVLVALLRGSADTSLLVPMLLVLVAALLAVVAAAVLALQAALRAGPGDGMTCYGPGRRVEVTWASRRHDRGRVEVEDVGQGQIVALPAHDGGLPHVTLRLGGHDLVVQGGPHRDADWYTVVDDRGYTLARAEAYPGPARRRSAVPVDWEVHPGHGPVLRFRHVRGAQPTGVTLLDDTGTAWWVRGARRAELPDELDPVSAVFVVLLIDQLGRP
jgi:hypothetical protein